MTDDETVREHIHGDRSISARDALAALDRVQADTALWLKHQAEWLELSARLEAENERLRWQIEHQGCAAARLGELTYECDATEPRGLCRLRARLDAARQALNALVAWSLADCPGGVPACFCADCAQGLKSVMLLAEAALSDPEPGGTRG